MYWSFWQIGTFYGHATYTSERPIVRKIRYQNVLDQAQQLKSIVCLSIQFAANVHIHHCIYLIPLPGTLCFCIVLLVRWLVCLFVSAGLLEKLWLNFCEIVSNIRLRQKKIIRLDLGGNLGPGICFHCIWHCEVILYVCNITTVRNYAITRHVLQWRNPSVIWQLTSACMIKIGRSCSSVSAV